MSSNKKQSHPQSIAGNTRYRFEQWVQNPDCKANVMSAVYGVRMSAIAEKDTGIKFDGPSPFALATGITFELNLFAKDAAVFREELAREELVPNADVVKFIDFRIRSARGPLEDLPEAQKRTNDFFLSLPKNAKTPEFFLIAGACVSIPGRSMLPEAVLILDAILLVGTELGWTIRVGEIKSYPDRGGFTSKSQLSTARAQAGVYGYALKLVLKHLGLDQPIKVLNLAMLILTKPGSNFPSIRPSEEITFQMERAERGFDKLKDVAEGISPLATEEERMSKAQAGETQYNESCFAFCPRASHCYKVQLEQGNPMVLGEDVARFTAGINLHRVIDLIGGKSKPANPKEEEFLDRFKAVEKLQKIGGA